MNWMDWIGLAFALAAVALAVRAHFKCRRVGASESADLYANGAAYNGIVAIGWIFETRWLVIVAALLALYCIVSARRELATFRAGVAR